MCALVVAAAVVGGLPALASPAAAGPASLETAAEGWVSAQGRVSAAAVESGERVEVVEERTEWETTYADPDGATFTLKKSITPVRVAAAEGGWAVSDARLVKRSDGSIGPAAAAVDLSFSAGGKGADLVTIAEGGQSVSLGWPGTLPAPKLG